MTVIVKPEHGILYMKVGTHAQETLDSIIARKTKEIEDAGYAMWGYGGNTCHPQTMVQPFAETVIRRGGAIYLCMQEVNSRHFAEQIRAEHYSVNGSKWDLVPSGINVLGSRYALVIDNLRKEEFELPLDRTRVAVGRSMGRVGCAYVKGQVDKACLEVMPASGAAAMHEERQVHIALVADLRTPFAVYLK